MSAIGGAPARDASSPDDADDADDVVARAALTRAPLDAAALLAEVTSPTCGATALFVGTVRELNDGRAVTGIDYAAYEAMAARELAVIAREAAVRHGARVAVEHRVGTLGVGDASVIVAAAHPHRAPAFDACRAVIEELKRRVPIWKREHYADGERAWVDPTRAAAAPGGVDAR